MHNPTGPPLLRLWDVDRFECGDVDFGNFPQELRDGYLAIDFSADYIISPSAETP